MKCKVCGRVNHYCTSCDYDKYLSDGYCDEECFKKGEEHKVFYKELVNFYNSLDEEQKHNLWVLWDNGILVDDMWEFIIDDIFINPLKDE